MSRLGERGFPWRVGVWVLWLAPVGLATAVFLLTRPPAGLPPVGSDAYRDTVGAFYRGLASLEVGLLDDARTQFSLAAELAPAEPAVPVPWAEAARRDCGGR